MRSVVFCLWCTVARALAAHTQMCFCTDVDAAAADIGSQLLVRFSMRHQARQCFVSRATCGWRKVLATHTAVHISIVVTIRDAPMHCIFVHICTDPLYHCDRGGMHPQRDVPSMRVRRVFGPGTAQSIHHWRRETLATAMRPLHVATCLCNE